MRNLAELKQRFRVLDPLYGPYELNEFTTRLVLTPEVQRLRNIRMCNINSLLVTGASEIARFEHTIGVLVLADEWGKQNNLTVKQRRVLCAAALLHDLQTPPFGHSLQYVLEDNRFADRFEHQIIGDVDALYHQDAPAAASFAGVQFQAQHILGNLWEEIRQTVAGKGEFGPLINGSMDLDNLDNVVRLAMHSGLASKDDVDSMRELAHNLILVNGQLSISAKFIPNVEQWQAVRKRLYDFLLLDWAEFSAKAMLTRAIEEAAAENILSVDSWLLTDNELMTTLDQESIGLSSLIKSLVQRLRRGDLYFPIALIETQSTAAYQELAGHNVKRQIESETTMALKRANLGKHSLLFHPILERGKTQRAVQLRLCETGKQVTIGSSSNRLLIGLFSAHEMTGPARQTATAKLQELLVQFGIVESSPTDDPFGLHFGRHNTSQFTLL